MSHSKSVPIKKQIHSLHQITLIRGIFLQAKIKNLSLESNKDIMYY